MFKTSVSHISVGKITDLSIFDNKHTNQETGLQKYNHCKKKQSENNLCFTHFTVWQKYQLNQVWTPFCQNIRYNQFIV